MKCPYCGGEVNTLLMKCKYCDSKIEVEQKNDRNTYSNTYNNTNNSSTRSSQNVVNTANTIKTIAIVFFVIVAITTLLGMFIPFIGTMIAFSSMSDLNVHLDAPSVSVEEERLVDRLPKNATDLVGEVVSCTTTGNATISYTDKNHYDVKILDTELIEWLVERGASIDGVGIMFSTDGDRNISEIALLSNPFYIISREEDTYVAYREDHVIAFTSEMELSVDSCYEGYFTYPDMSLHGGTTTDCGTSAFFSDPMCDEKMTTTEKTRYDEEVTVYKIRAGSDWYYCSKDTYDRVNIGDAMNDYTFANSGYKYVY